MSEKKWREFYLHGPDCDFDLNWKLIHASEYPYKDSVSKDTISVIEIGALKELQAENEHLKRQLADAMSGCCDCPMFKSSQAENEELKAFINRMNQFVVPGTTDTGDSIKMVVEKLEAKCSRYEAALKQLRMETSEAWTQVFIKRVLRTEEALKDGGEG